MDNEKIVILPLYKIPCLGYRVGVVILLKRSATLSLKSTQNRETLGNLNSASEKSHAFMSSIMQWSRLGL